MERQTPSNKTQYRNSVFHYTKTCAVINAVYDQRVAHVSANAYTDTPLSYIPSIQGTSHTHKQYGMWIARDSRVK